MKSKENSIKPASEISLGLSKQILFQWVGGGGENIFPCLKPVVLIPRMVNLAQ